MSYFRFLPNCWLISGPARLTLHTLFNGKTYHLSMSESEIVRALTSNISVEEVLKKYGVEASNIINRYIEDGYATFFDSPVYAEPYYPTNRFETKTFMSNIPVMKIAFIQITDACDAKCSFCHNDDFYQWQGCNSCLRWPQGGINERLDLQKAESTLNILNDISVPCVKFSGGNPLQEFHLVESVSEKFRTVSPNMALSINTNGRYLNDYVAKAAKRLNLVFNFSIFGSCEENYTEVTNDPNLYQDLLKAVSLCQDWDIEYSLTLVITPAMRNNYTMMRNFASSLRPKAIYTTEVLRKDDKMEKLVSSPTGSDRVEHVGATEFFHRRKFNFCMDGKIGIGSNGSFVPCPSWLDAIGHIDGPTDFRRLFSGGSIYSFWENSKGQAAVCENCENRYACVDCSLLESECAKDATVQQYFCDYIPESGEWRNTRE
jgi:pyruvate-formate lyase-activating enzyme